MFHFIEKNAIHINVCQAYIKTPTHISYLIEKYDTEHLHGTIYELMIKDMAIMFENMVLRHFAFNSPHYPPVIFRCTTYTESWNPFAKCEWYGKVHNFHYCYYLYYLVILTDKKRKKVFHDFGKQCHEIPCAVKKGYIHIKNTLSPPAIIHQRISFRLSNYDSLIFTWLKILIIFKRKLCTTNIIPTGKYFPAILRLA